MSRLSQDTLELAAAYALGSLDEAERRKFEALLAAGDPELEAAVAEFSEGVVALARSAPEARPSAALRSRVLAAARAERPAGASATRSADDGRRVLELPVRRAPAFWNWMPLAAAAALAIVTAITWMSSNTLRTQLAATQGDLERLKHQLEVERGWVAVLNAPGAQVVSLGATPSGDSTLVGRATYDPATQRAVLVFDHLSAPQGREYELWAIRPGGPASLGVIKTDASGHAVLRLSDVGDPASLAAFAVSLEPAGGSPTPNAPTGPVVMVGKLAG